ncbi:hypothetical protein BpHYR1_054084 [Brachionus plicatilis]|uniref:Uncharacterized protein n=1 Tax=Brachionus plicatilis TaxID=10195 RepID=A0A3M7RX83_BRAPC|nr:hypothetical protein BpHYR1_054084 [Brachionus plicatilis]
MFETQMLNKSNCERDLGIFIQSDLKWDAQVRSSTAKANLDVMEEIEAQEAEMEIQNEVEVENNSNENSAQSEIPKKERGRPIGSKNKPKSIQDQPQNKRTKKD